MGLFGIGSRKDRRAQKDKNRRAQNPSDPNEEPIASSASEVATNVDTAMTALERRRAASARAVHNNHDGTGVSPGSKGPTAARSNANDNTKRVRDAPDQRGGATKKDHPERSKDVRSGASTAAASSGKVSGAKTNAKRSRDKSGSNDAAVSAAAAASSAAPVAAPQAAPRPSSTAVASRVGGHRRTKESGDALLDRFRERIAGSTFRLLNEQIYTSPNAFAAQLLRDRRTFDDYHDGYRQQLALWPVNPAEIVAGALNKDKRGRFLQGDKAKHMPGTIPATWVVADMGCGDARIAQRLAELQHANVVHSFDFCAANARVTPCDMSAVPLKDATVDVAVFCLSLMATDYTRYIVEAHRILKPQRLLKIIEVRSRVPSVERFEQLVASFGFTLLWSGVVGNYFVAFDFMKNAEGDAATSAGGAGWKGGGSNRYGQEQQLNPAEVLLPCIYKRR